MRGTDRGDPVACSYDLTVVSVADVERLINGPIGLHGASEVALIGQGAWSSAYGFDHGSRALVIRIGQHISDFRRDEAMSLLATPALPIPEVIEIGQVPSGGSTKLHYCVSTRAFGEPLENCLPSEWLDLAERVADVLEAMRMCSPPLAGAPGGSGAVKRWSDQLLEIERDDLDPRGAGWRAKLAHSDCGSEAFRAGVARLKSLDVGDVPPTLVHADLINRNVHVENGRITGVFDWGCQRWGDHLFDLCWFEFWAPWHTNLDVDPLRAALERRWSRVGYVPQLRQERSLACLIYIGLEHLIYNATIDRWDNLDDVVDRMTALELL